MRLARRSTRLASLAAALAVGALAVVLVTGQFGNSARAQTTEGGMAVDCDVVTAGVQDACGAASGSEFAVQVHVTSTPAAGYTNFQTKLRWTDANLQYLPTADPADEGLWPECDIPARQPEEPGVPPNNPEGTAGVLFGCVQFAVPPAEPVSKTEPSAVLQFTFRCDVDGDTTIELVAREGDPQLGSHFIGPDQEIYDPATLAPATITCGGEPPPPPGEATPTATGGVPGGPTATTVGGGVAPTALPSTGAPGQLNEDDTSTLWLILSAVGAMTAAGLGLFSWRYARSRR